MLSTRHQHGRYIVIWKVVKRSSPLYPIYSTIREPSTIGWPTNVLNKIAVRPSQAKRLLDGMFRIYTRIADLVRGQDVGK
jgi:hypothetical protein